MLIEGKPLEDLAAPLHDLLRVGLESRPDEVAMVSAEREMAWQGLEGRSAGLAHAVWGLASNPATGSPR